MSTRTSIISPVRGITATRKAALTCVRRKRNGGQSRGEERASSLRSGQIRVFGTAVVRSDIDIMALRSRPPPILGYEPSLSLLPSLLRRSVSTPHPSLSPRSRRHTGGLAPPRAVSPVDGAARADLRRTGPGAASPRGFRLIARFRPVCVLDVGGGTRLGAPACRRSVRRARLMSARPSPSGYAPARCRSRGFLGRGASPGGAGLGSAAAVAPRPSRLRRPAFWQFARPPPVGPHLYVWTREAGSTSPSSSTCSPGASRLAQRGFTDWHVALRRLAGGAVAGLITAARQPNAPSLQLRETAPDSMSGTLVSCRLGWRCLGRRWAPIRAHRGRAIQRQREATLRAQRYERLVEGVRTVWPSASGPVRNSGAD